MGEGGSYLCAPDKANCFGDLQVDLLRRTQERELKPRYF